MKLCLVTVASLVALTPVFLVSAQSLPCGNIVEPEDIVKINSPIKTTAIDDCLLPFGELSSGNPFSMTFEGNVVTDGAVLSVPSGGNGNYSFTDTASVNNEFKRGVRRVYKHVGNDYEYIETPLLTTEPEYTALARAFLGESIDVGPYVRAIINGTVYEEFTDYEDQDRYFNYEVYVEENKSINYPKLTAGDYTVVWPVYGFGFGQLEPSFWNRLWDVVLPTAFAGYFNTPTLFDVYAVTFTIAEAEPEPEPTGASSVLFLPGIMGSRLYEIGQQCGDFGQEQERWFSTADCEQLRLLSGSTGNSLNDIYTKAGASSIIDEVYVFNLYKTFVNTLQGWKDDEIIDNYALVPYDWRMRLDYLLKTEKNADGKIKYNEAIEVSDGYLYKTLEALAASSTTGKVTIITHSNGGLLAKTLLATLQNTSDPLLSKIDNLIMVGAPQLGTPSTLFGMLHGDEIGPYGKIVSQLNTRRLTSTMPMAFHLLPNNSYFNSTGVTVESPVVTFENGNLTTRWTNTFGSTIQDAATLQRFLSTDSGRVKPAVTDLVNPEVVSKYLFTNYTGTIDELINTWSPPESMNVYQIAGIGLPTQTGITYFTDRECIERNIFLLFKCIAYRDKIGFRPNETIDGDETVVTPSALAMSTSQDNVERWWLNLDNYNSEGIGGIKNINRRHKDIFEVPDVINFIKNTLEATTSVPYLYLTNIEPNFPSENRLVVDLHSPLDLSIVTSNGETISSSSVTVADATYKRFGEMQHISLPDTPVGKTIKLTGKATGSFTLEIGEQVGNTVIKRHTYSAIPSSFSTKVTLDLEPGKAIEDNLLLVDYDGNGTVEIVYNTSGEVVPAITYDTLKNAVFNLDIKSLYKKLLLENIKIAEQYHTKSLVQLKYKKLEIVALNVLKQQVLLYERIKIISPAQKQELTGMIDQLLRN